MDAVRENDQSGKRLISGIVIQAGKPPDYTPLDMTTPDTGKGGYDFRGEDIGRLLEE